MALFVHRLEIGFNNLRVKGDEWKKGTSFATFCLVSRGEGEWGSGFCFPFSFFFFQDCSYQIRRQLAGSFLQKPILIRIHLFSNKIFVSLWHNFSPRKVNDKVAIITIPMRKINQNAANLSYDILFQIK